MRKKRRAREQSECEGLGHACQAKDERAEEEKDEEENMNKKGGARNRGERKKRAKRKVPKSPSCRVCFRFPRRSTQHHRRCRHGRRNRREK